MPKKTDKRKPQIIAALNALGIRNVLLGIHDPAFPARPGEDTGRGSPYSGGARDFVEFASRLGFTGIQLGPQGMTTLINTSPYDGTLFSRNPLGLDPFQLAGRKAGLLPRERLEVLLSANPVKSGAVKIQTADRIITELAIILCNRYRQLEKAQKESLRRTYGSFDRFRRQNGSWLTPDAVYEILRKNYRNRNWQKWGDTPRARLDKYLYAPPPGQMNAARHRLHELLRLHSAEIENYAFIQYLLAGQHRRLRKHCRNLGMKIYGDCQIGFSGRDGWSAQSFLLRDYVMGAPPSRTNPEGQPWNYPVYDPQQYFINNDAGGGDGPAIEFVRRRLKKLFTEYDGLRLDHPHGLICPWVYKARADDPIRAVQNGARLFASPDLEDHPQLRQFAIARPEQLDRQAHRYDDHWVKYLDDRQIRRYAALCEVIMEEAEKSSAAGDIICEILSTQPYPVQKVMELYGLGRFRVTQKADLDNPDDVYRTENAAPEDWLMLGNHDTRSVWRLADSWIKSGASHRQAQYLAGRLAIPEAERESWIQRHSRDAGALAQAKFADLFIGPGRNIFVYFTDLLGIKETYNSPGTVSAQNWSLRVPPDYRQKYPTSAGRGKALDIPKALAMAMRARGKDFSREHRGLIEKLENSRTSG